MMILDNFFSYLCHGENRLVIDSLPLPLCQRCLGLYAGAGLTAMWLLASGVWRGGLPPGRIVLLHAALLLTAMLGGLHILDLGPTWRMLCGAWTGHVALFWLAAGAAQLRAASRDGGRPLIPWSRSETAAAFAAAVLVSAIACIPSLVSPTGRTLWLILAFAGVLSLAATMLAAIFTLCVSLKHRLSQAP